jgi:hypothetical protein
MATTSTTSTPAAASAATPPSPVDLVRQALSLADGGSIPRVLPQDAVQKLLAPGVLPEAEDTRMLRDVLQAWSGRLSGGDGWSAMKAEFHPPPSFAAGEPLCRELKAVLSTARSRRVPADLVTQIGNWLDALTHLLAVDRLGPTEADGLIRLRDTTLVAVGATDADGNALPPVEFVLTSNKKVEARRSRAQAKAMRKRGHRGPGRRSSSFSERKTCRAVLKTVRSGGSGERVQLRVKETLVALQLPRHGYVVAEKLVAWVAKLCGRIETWFEAWISAKALIVGKVGLVYDHLAEAGVLEDLATKPHTLAFLAMAIAEFGARKAFTIESQKQGALNEFLRLLLGLVKLHEPEGLAHIAWILPVQEMMVVLDGPELEALRAAHEAWLPILGRALSELWSSGIARCFRRGRAVVLPRSFGQCHNSTCWNHSGDAWTNITRFIRAVDHCVGADSGPRVLVKVLQVVAGDQAMWASGAGKGVHPDVQVFRTLTCELGFFPWKLALGAEEWQVDAVLELFGATGRPQAWLGVPQLREEDVRIHTDMVCGVAVPPELVEACIEIGAFGAHPYGGADVEDAGAGAAGLGDE